MVYVTEDNETFFTLHEPAKSGSHVEANVGWQPAPYASETLVEKAVAMKAAMFFAESGQLEPSSDWRLSSTREGEEA